MLLHARIYKTQQQPDPKVLPAMARSPICAHRRSHLPLASHALSPSKPSPSGVAYRCGARGSRAKRSTMDRHESSRMLRSPTANDESNGAAQRKSVGCVACFTVAWW
jgi:hypothetical protein